ncbi:MAG TPA: ExeM/NucH family extracellular endonuclease [Rhizobiaceae bacterium]|nr:ExeM/NucH family extracellular endonuclease [Rhizobiaceae bacterium]
MSFHFPHWLPKFYLGTWRPDTITGSNGNDVIISFGGDDVIDARGGNDTILSGGGDDMILAGSGNDTVNAGDGDDVIDLGAGNDKADGGRGFDTVIYEGSILDYSIERPGRWDKTIKVRDIENGGIDRLERVEALYFGADDYTLYLDGRNNSVLARDDAFATDENQLLSVLATDLTENDSEFDGDTLTVVDVSAISAAGATVSLLNGTISYDQGDLFDHLREGETATDTFSYTVSDGRGGTDTATVTITINGINDGPVITSAAAANFEENGSDPVLTATAEDVDSDTVTFSIAGGADAALFTIDAETGVLRFVDAPDFELPADQGGDNIYDVTIAATDEQGGETTQDISVTVTNVDETPPAPRINEIHYDNAGADTGEFVEVRVAKGTDVSAISVVLYNGSNGQSYGTFALNGNLEGSDDAFDYCVLDTTGIQNGAPDGLALVDGGEVIEFLSYEGTLTASNGPAAGMTSTDIGVLQAGSDPAGLSLQRSDDGTTWDTPREETPGAANSDDGPGVPTARLISQIQGTGSASQLQGDYVLVSAVVTYTIDNGFFLQEETADQDGNVLSSEGIFVFTGGAPTVDVGDHVEVAGTVTEFFGLTEITNLVSIDTISSGNDLPDYANVTLPNATATSLEQFEGMRISLTSGTSDPITVVENFNLARYGEITVSAGNQYQPTQLYDPDTQAAEIAALMEANALNRLIIDDGVSAQNPDAFAYLPANFGDNGNGYIDAGDDFSPFGPTLRLGAEMNGPIEGVLSYGFDAYRMHVDGMLSIDQDTNTGTRTEAPADVGGRLKVASFNLLNFFTSLREDYDPNVPGTGSGPGDLEPRGALNAFDFERQLDKIVTAMLGVGADVFGLQELENNGFGSDSAIRALVDALNAELGANVYAFVDPTGGTGDGFIGTDAITTGVIYDQTKVSVAGSNTLEFSSVAADGQQLHRPAVAVAFEEIATGERFNVAVNHLKSKGDSGLTDVNDPNYDQGDGQGFWNAAREEAAIELAQWLATDPTGSGDADTLIIGDLNSYAQEDPVDALRDAGYTDLIDQFIGQDQAYSYVFDGMRGTLDQGLATSSLLSQVTGVTEWHVNADEPGLFAYSSEFTNPAFYDNNPFATSDHDPLLIGLNLGTVII